MTFIVIEKPSTDGAHGVLCLATEIKEATQQCLPEGVRHSVVHSDVHSGVCPCSQNVSM